MLSPCFYRGFRRLAGILAGVILSGSAVQPACSAPRARRPNVVVIITDDQGWADIGFNNPDRAFTPNLDALAASGARLERHYVMPQCTPTRAAVLTGRLPSRLGGQALQASNEPAFPLGTPTLASMLQAAGYETFLCGKWHLGSTPAHGPQHFGFDHAYGSLAGAVGMYDHRYRKGPFEVTWHNDGTPIPGHENGRHATDLVADRAVQCIEAEHVNPFFLYLAFHAPHTPLDERGRFTDRPTQRDPADPTRWLNEADIEWFNDPEGRIQSEPDPERRLLLAAVHHVDHAIGRVLTALDQEGIREETLVLFSSDNGPQVTWPGNAYPDDLALTNFNQPLPMRGRKCDVWEGGIHVPGIISWPGTIRPHLVTTPVHITDWLPTVADITGCTPPVSCDGISLERLLLEQAPLPERSLYWVWRNPIDRRALRQGDWKIVHYGKHPPTTAAAWKLFNLQQDPEERQNLAAEHPEQLALLHALFQKEVAQDATPAAR